jgi:hypothetical protein
MASIKRYASPETGESIRALPAPKPLQTNSKTFCNNHTKGTSMNPIEHSPKTTSPRTGIFALLSSLLRVKGTRASKIGKGRSAISYNTSTCRPAFLVALAIALCALAYTAGPALAAISPTVTIKPVGTVTTTTAQVSGTVNPNGSLTTTSWEFQYSKNPETEGWASGAPGAAGTVIGSEPVSGTLEGLQPNATYQVRLVATNGEGGEGVSAEPNPTFTTKAIPPTVSESVSNVNTSEATLEGTVNPNNQLTECHFQYGTQSVSENTVPCTPAVLEATFVDQEVSPKKINEKGETVPAPIGVSPGTEYKYRIVTKNAKGEVGDGPEQSFKTAEEPEKQPAEPVRATEATLKGVLNPHNEFEAGTYEFTYEQSATECIGPAGPHGELPYKTAPVPAEPSTKASSQPVSATIAGLQPGATYTFCLLERNASGQQAALSPPETFTTLAAAPAISVSGEQASGVTSTEATLNAQIDPNGAETHYYFQYGTTTSYTETPTPLTKLGGTLIAADTAIATITGLQPGTTYHYRVVAENKVGGKTETEDGKDTTFTTPAAPVTTAETCPNAQLRAEQPYGPALPDCRAYEMVSPAATNGQDATVPAGPSSTSRGLRASVKGEAIAYAARGAFANPEGSGPLAAWGRGLEHAGDHAATGNA